MTEHGTTSSGSQSSAVGFDFVDFDGCGAGDLVMLAVRANAFRQQVESYLSAVLVRLGELEGEDAVISVCKQFDLPAYKARRQARTAKGLRVLPDVMRAAKDGWITMDHAELMAASHGRAPMNTDEQLDLLAIGVQQDPDVFKATLAKYEVKRLADAGLNPTEQQRARRTAKIFNGDNDMVILHAELDHVAGERVKTAMDALTTRMLKRDFQTGVERSFEQRNADALVQLITTHTTPARTTPAEYGSGIGRATRTGRRDTSMRRAKPAAEVNRANRTGEHNTGDTNNTRTSHAHRSQQATGHHPKHQNTSDKTNRASDSDRSNQIPADDSHAGAGCYEDCTDTTTNTGDTDAGTNTGCTDTGCAPAPEPTPQATTIILTADYDAITGQLTAAGLIDGTPIGIDEIRRLACEAEIIPMIFNSEAQPLYLGRTRRKHTKAQKLALYKRDKHCTSCGIRASNCDVHHITPWEQGGTTNIDNLTLLCPTCHRQTHKHTHPPTSQNNSP
ncbi:MAG: DUF222 domain-containing protein [bacterium]|nr:DUF222 domain-containing protein [bacterium]